MSKLILPRIYLPEIDAPFIFLAGPIRSAPNWQSEAIDIIFSQEPNFIIASPRWEIKYSASKHIFPGDEKRFSRQREWERHYLDIASKKGAILFWLPGEERHDCDKVYGAMTRIELGQWMTNYRHDNSLNFCVGSDWKFPEIDTIAYDLSADAPGLHIKNSLEETCSEAIRLAKK